ncbi:class I SAM-dependent methyltransferase [Actinocrinis puniceicyclus]|uniref:Class I SAM-dependent methyltransferase n=1 Tax=Actinocrinis puniceicyclus TaxID=977794 RepID=A0A8J7WSG7_9ACTN|nr:class I SAM-dependent methyltransferase [Actinocrinis puniceicyclus]MBS2966753.1 class I SAM-dependent methyltransferase [Actinocrinis puniceicyclus]
MTASAAGTRLAHRWHTARDYDTLARRIQFRNAELVAGLHPQPHEVAGAYEIGCGTGALTEALVRRLPVAEIDAVDISADMLAVAAGKPWPQRVRFSQGAFPDVPRERRYDAVFSNAALHWMHPRYPEVFAAINELLADGGLVCAATAGRTPATERFAETCRAALAPLSGLCEPDEFEARRLTLDEAAELSRAAGFTIDDAFVLERTVLVTTDTYARWWVASGGPWTATQVPAETSVDALTTALGGVGREVELVHASVFLRLRKQGPVERA